jgi:neutral ceramidase
MTAVTGFRPQPTKAIQRLCVSLTQLTLACVIMFADATAFASDIAPQTMQPYLIGRGMADVTGPAVGVQLWGFGRPDQIGEGIHIRQRSRAFVIAQADNPKNRLAFVSADLGSIDHHIALEVVDRLQQRIGDDYTLNNVIITATHTHSGPGGYWHPRSDSGLDGGLYPEHFEAIVAGITESITRAHADLQPGNITINTGEVSNAGTNRSNIAYLANPLEERQRFTGNTNTTMTLLKFVDDSGAIGMLNWYALHPTAMNFHNRLISGDHKGYASVKMEQQQGTTYASDDDFVAAFAQSDPGDVTPNTNLDNTGPGATDVETTQIMGERQLQVAQRLFQEASSLLAGPIASRQIYVNFSNFEVADQFTGAGAQRTCPSAYGYSFAGGSTEDGGAHFLFEEGMTKQKAWLDWLIRVVTGAPKWTQAVKDCQHPKPILFESGTGNPPLQSQIHTVTIARIGQLVILALPAEVTTMAGRRLRETVMAELDDWAQYYQLAGYANGYGGYITTPEEYQLQQYEAAHTLHGQWSLPAYQQVASQLAQALQSGLPIESVAQYDDWRGKSVGMPLPQGVELGKKAVARLGQARSLSKVNVAPGETVVAEFWSANPTADYGAAPNYLAVERKTQSGWQPVAKDGDWNTRIRWRTEAKGYLASLSWQVPSDAPDGVYSFVHFGFDKTRGSFSGRSAELHVMRPQP